MGTLKGRRAVSSPSDAAQDGPAGGAGCATLVMPVLAAQLHAHIRTEHVRDSSGRHHRERYGISSAAPTVLSMTPTRQSGGVFGITSNTLVRSSKRQYIGWYGGAPTAAGWGEGCWTGPPISSPPGSAPSHCSYPPT